MKNLLKIFIGALVLMPVFFALHEYRSRSDSKDSDSARLLALRAAELGRMDLVEKLRKRVKFARHMSDVNACTAFYMHKISDPNLNDFLENARPFNRDLFIKLTLENDISKEPDFMSKLLPVKYIRKIDEISKLEYKITSLYMLGTKMKGEGGSKYRREALKLLESMRHQYQKTEPALEIMDMSLNAGEPGDFFRAAGNASWSFYTDALILRAISLDNFREYLSKDKKILGINSYLANAASASDMLSKNEINRFEKLFMYAPLRYGFRWNSGTLSDFNNPLLAFVCKIYGRDDVFKKYLAKSTSEEVLKRNEKGKRAYIPFLISVLAELEMYDEACGIALKYPELSGEIPYAILHKPAKNDEILEKALQIYEKSQRNRFALPRP